MSEQLIVECRKCGHQVYLTNPTLTRVVEMVEYDCPECGEEGDRNWTIVGQGDFDALR
jgi:endogenous inhibitor of DNA gyrase (YacG/DUF329 family)